LGGFRVGVVQKRFSYRQQGIGRQPGRWSQPPKKRGDPGLARLAKKERGAKGKRVGHQYYFKELPEKKRLNRLGFFYGGGKKKSKHGKEKGGVSTSRVMRGKSDPFYLNRGGDGSGKKTSFIEQKQRKFITARERVMRSEGFEVSSGRVVVLTLNRWGKEKG